MGKSICGRYLSSCEEQPLSDKTLSRFRKRCYDYESVYGIDLLHDCITGLGSKIAKMMDINPRIKRMDSMMIAANIRKLSRTELLDCHRGCCPSSPHKRKRWFPLRMLQNPSDPDATYRTKTGKEHQGYVANLEETVGKNGTVITDYQYEQ